MPLRALLLTALLCTCAPASLPAQNALFPATDARARALGGTGLTAAGQAGLWTNPAALGRGQQGVAAGAAAEQRFGLSELLVATAGASYGLKENGGFGLQLASVGFDAYRENRIGLAYGRRLAERFTVGLELVGFSTVTRGYASSFDLTVGLGLQLEIIPELAVGARIFSPFRVERAPEEFLPQLLAVGLSYRPSERVRLNAEAHQDAEFPLRFRLGAEYLPAESLAIRLGIASEASEISFGLGYRVGETLALDATAVYHETLGVFPAFGLRYR